MSRYRKIGLDLWGDHRFRALSRPGPSAQYLYIYLSYGPNTTILPGLFESGMLGIAEKLRWPFPEAERCFQELFEQGMVHYDPDALVFWIPGSIGLNYPANQNTVKSWRQAWDLIPSSLLKYHFIEELKTHLDQDLAAMAPQFAEHFPELSMYRNQGLPKPHSLKRGVGLPKPQGGTLRLSEVVGLPYTGTGTGTGTGEEEEKEKKNKKEKEEEMSRYNLTNIDKESFNEFCK